MVDPADIPFHLFCFLSVLQYGLIHFKAKIRNKIKGVLNSTFPINYAGGKREKEITICEAFIDFGKDTMKQSKRRPLASVIAAGCSKYGKREGLYSRELFLEAFSELLESCPKLSTRHLDALYLGQAFESFEHQANTAVGVANEILNLPNIPAVRVESVSSSGGTAFRQALISIVSGLYDVVLAGGCEKMTHLETNRATEVIAMAADFPFEQWCGATLPALNALVAREHIRKFGTTEEQMAKVAVKNHKNAFYNPKAHFHKLITVEDVLSSKPIATPLKLFDCSPISDGASCVVLTKPEIATRFADDPIDVIGSGEATDKDFVFRTDWVSFTSTKIAARQAYETAGLEPKDLDFAEIHDAFTINEIVGYEDLGLCNKGEGGRMIDEGKVALDGEIPVNTSGGLKGKGHPIGSSGTGQVYEAFLQLTGRAEKNRQLSNPKIGLTHSMGGAGVTAEVQIFKRRI
jgi:acetyl-CoA C-acetyltransferase